MRVKIVQHETCDWPQDRTSYLEASADLQKQWKDLPPDTPIHLFAVTFDYQHEAVGCGLSAGFRLSDMVHGDWSNYRLSRYFGAPVTLRHRLQPEMRLMEHIVNTPPPMRHFVVYGHFTWRHIDAETDRACIEIGIIHAEDKNDIMTEQLYLELRQKSANEVQAALVRQGHECSELKEEQKAEAERGDALANYVKVLPMVKPADPNARPAGWNGRKEREFRRWLKDGRPGEVGCSENPSEQFLRYVFNGMLEELKREDGIRDLIERSKAN
jgi:hypothetical protein